MSQKLIPNAFLSIFPGAYLELEGHHLYVQNKIAQWVFQGTLDDEEVIIKIQSSDIEVAILLLLDSEHLGFVPRIKLSFQDEEHHRMLISEQVLPFVYSTAAARMALQDLHYFHSLDIIHGDIAPGNLMSSARRPIVWIDFDPSSYGTPFFSTNTDKAQRDVVALGRTLLQFQYAPEINRLFRESILRMAAHNRFERSNGPIDGHVRNWIEMKRVGPADLGSYYLAYASEQRMGAAIGALSAARIEDPSIPSDEKLAGRFSHPVFEEINEAMKKATPSAKDFLLAFQGRMEEKDLYTSLLFDMALGKYHTAREAYEASLKIGRESSSEVITV